jgi:hypothetical protein
MVEKDGASGLELVLVDDRKNWGVEIETLVGSDDRVVIVNDLFEVTNSEWCASDLVDLDSFLFLLLVLWLEKLLVLDELFLHDQVVLDSLLSEEAKAAL